MRYIFIISAIAICLTGCGGSSDAKPVSTYHAPTNYAAATRAASNGDSLDIPVSPQNCEPVKVIGTVGTVIVQHGANSTTIYTANASGDFVSTNGLSLNMLMPPGATLWLTVSCPTDAVVEWSGAQFTSVVSSGATWTAPNDASYDHATTVINVTVTLAPVCNG